MSLDYRIVPVTPFEQNCSRALVRKDPCRAQLIDPGGDVERLIATPP
jgi:hydroxyacylglutathione hydrolase